MSRSVQPTNYRRDPYVDAGRALYLIEHPGVDASVWPLVDQETRDWWVSRARPIADAVRRAR
ncbi:hypothetical protein ACFFGR_09370 [Arthrobacter liuii]|uniref:hypothetical protein n=1 Tax=Arthrobacter liuii TaxID=1476996 RepID=UPI001663AE01|nr:hypothetical protein [Arthrobacter liuii]